MKNYSQLNKRLTKEQITGQIILNNSSESIGTYEFDVKEDSFMAVVNIYPDYQNSGIGFYVFKYCFDKLSESNNLKYFIASWHCHPEYSHSPNQQSTNLYQFLKFIGLGINEVQALWQTPTGKWLKRIGFNDAKIIHKNSESVNALFSK